MLFRKSKRLYELLVLQYSNEGREYLVEYYKIWDEKVREIARGLTILKPAKGHWVSPREELFA